MHFLASTPKAITKREALGPVSQLLAHALTCVEISLLAELRAGTKP